jgi:serine/threonine protein phosphatase 1
MGIGNWHLQPPSIAPGERIYAIGDVHGHFDLFAKLIALINADAKISPAEQTKIIVIGDLIDRGPHSAEVVECLRKYTDQSDRMIVLKGNHEQVMVQALRGDLEALNAWLQFGGDTTLDSWGVSRDAIEGPLPELFRAAVNAVPQDVLRWLERLPLTHRSQDFFFVHAGIRPGVDLDEQRPADMLWITDDFLDVQEPHQAVIVHGHSICEHGPEILRHRIGLDTGAYRTGRLSAVGFEGSRQWMLSAT